MQFNQQAFPSMLRDPVRYAPSVEAPEPDEAETARKLVETMRAIIETTHRDTGHALRSVHAKSHALLQGRMQVFDNPEPLAQGLFARPGTHRVVMRLSTNPGDILPDDVSVPRGLAIKIGNAERPRLPGSEGHDVQDLVLVNAPAFVAPNARKFLGNLQLLAATTDRAPRAKQILSKVLRGVESALETVGAGSATITAIGGHPMTHPLGETFYSQTAFRYGDYIAKFSVAPVSPELEALTRAPLDVRGRPDGLREATTEFFRNQGGKWEVRVQLCCDLDIMPVEDASVEWPEEVSPYIAVAEITVAPQPAWNEDRSRAIDDGLSFSPWNGLEAHRPLGSINRTRRAAYEMSARFRSASAELPGPFDSTASTDEVIALPAPSD